MSGGGILKPWLWSGGRVVGQPGVKCGVAREAKRSVCLYSTVQYNLSSL